MLDYDHYLARLTELARDVPLILHSLTESQVNSSVSFLLSKGAIHPVSAAADSGPSVAPAHARD